MKSLNGSNSSIDYHVHRLDHCNDQHLHAFRRMNETAASLEPNKLLMTADEHREMPDTSLIDLMRDGVILAAYETLSHGEHPVGLGALKALTPHKRRHFGELGSMYVDAEHRGKGVGSLLVDRLIDEARARNLEALELYVTSRNQDAIRLYQRFGFTIYGTLPKALRTEDGYMDGLYMVRELDRH